jgi:CRISPR-associated protein Cmr1
LAGEAGAALWAWLTFGGLGARTRRGCGSLRCTSHAQFAPPTNLNQLATWLKQKRADHVTPIPPLATGEERVPRLLPVPTLAGAVVVWGQQATSVEAAWGQALRPMRELRQGEGIGRTPGWVRANGQYRPSISYWPEPNSLRVKLGIMDPDHPADPEKPLYFPRADLGLPIIFQRLRTGGGNPVLQAVGDGTTRFASPVVLKPLSLAPNQAVALFLLLNSPRVWSADRQVSPGIEVVDGGTSYPLATADLFDAAKSARVRPLAGPPVPPAGQPTTPPLDARSAAVSIYRARFAQWVRL